MIEKRVQAVRKQMADAAARAGRNPEEILLIAASKTKPASDIKRAILAGVDGCGENRVQELVEKSAQGAYAGAPVHFIGRLQKNKIKQVVGKTDLIQSADSLELLRLIGAKAVELQIVQPVLIQINIGREDSKTGFYKEDVSAVMEEAGAIDGLMIRGLMAIPPISEKSGQNRRYFMEMYQLYVDIKGKKYDNVFIDYLSMGMSGDFEDAILEGSNMIRVGSAIFGSRSQ